MFAKVFYQIFESSISEDHVARHIFMDMLVLADEEGVIDKTPEAIARITNVPIDIVNRAIFLLCQPDERSRTQDEDGRRLSLIDDHRDWGWRIVNYLKYRGIRDQEARRIANRSYKRDQRKKQKEEELSALGQHVSAPVLDSQQMSAQEEVEEEVEEDIKTTAKTVRDARSREAVARVWEFYISTFKKNPLANKFSDKRKQKGKTCFAHCLELMEDSYEDAESLMKEAVIGLSRNKFFMEKDLTSWERHIFSSVEKMEERWQDFRKGR